MKYDFSLRAQYILPLTCRHLRLGRLCPDASPEGWIESLERCFAISSRLYSFQLLFVTERSARPLQMKRTLRFGSQGEPRSSDCRSQGGAKTGHWMRSSLQLASRDLAGSVRFFDLSEESSLDPVHERNGIGGTGVRCGGDDRVIDWFCLSFRD